MIQDIYPHRLDIAFRADAVPEAGSLVFQFHEGKLAARFEGGEVAFPEYAAYPSQCPMAYLFQLDGKDCFLALDEDTAVPAGFQLVSMRQVRAHAGGRKQRVFAAITARHVHDWVRRNRHCGICGALRVPAPDERALDCPACGNRLYPRIEPAVIVGVIDREADKLLLTKYAGRAEVPYYALVAGYTEIGETLEQTCAREVFEETGLAVKNIRYYKSQPWGLSDGLMVGYFCDLDGSSQVTLRDGELALAEWFARTEIEGQPDDFSLTNEMMTAFAQGLEP